MSCFTDILLQNENNCFVRFIGVKMSLNACGTKPSGSRTALRAQGYSRFTEAVCRR